MTNDAYRRAGVDIDAANQATSLMKAAIRTTYTMHVLSDTGSFGGQFDASALKDMKRPILVASTDGVGTKTKVATRMKRWHSIGADLVNHCINDILVQGATPLFFLDYIASSKLEPEHIALVVSGMADACRAADCALLGGETAEMPGVYTEGEIDVVGTVVGVVDHEKLLTGKDIRVGDVILGLPSTGLHTNGYSLARAALDSLDWSTPHPNLDTSIGDALLAVHRSYLHPIQTLRAGGIAIHGLAHITGGGIIENLPRILPEQTGAVIARGSWPELAIFSLIQTHGQVSDEEMFRVFNMGLGMLVVLPVEQVTLAESLLPGDLYRVGEIVAGAGVKVI